jgi:nicotinamide mononucleotide transporter
MLVTSLEPLAVALALAYVVLAIRQNILCWPVNIISAAIYFFLFISAGIYMLGVLQLLYIGMGVYGWVSWRRQKNGEEVLRVTAWPPIFHLIPLLLIMVMTLICGQLLAVGSDAALPYYDAFVTWCAIVAVWMVARKVLHNWQYWFIADVVSVYMFVSQELWPTAALYVVYLLLCPVGYRSWLKDLKQGT